MYKPIYLIACVMAVMAFCTSGDYAGTTSFNNSSGGQGWQTAGNWTAGIPGSGDTAVIGMNGANSATISGAGAVCYNLYVGLSGYVTGTAGQLDITGGSLTTSNSINIGYNEPGAFVVSGGTVTENGSSGTTFGSGGGSGTLEIDTGGTYTSNGYFYSGTGSEERVKVYGGTLILNGGMQALNAAGQMDITGTGTLILNGVNRVADLTNYASGGYICSSSPLNYGPVITYDSVNNRTIVTSGPRTPVSVLSWTNGAGNNRWNTPGNWNVLSAVPYQSETAVIAEPNTNCIIDSNTAAVCNNLYVGLSSYGGNGQFVMTGGTLNAGNTVSNGFYIGYDKTGTFTLSGGNVTSVGTVYVGGTATGSGTFVMTGGTLTTNTMNIPYYGTGMVQLYGGTINITSSNTTGLLMHYFGGTGTMDIKGTGTLTWVGNHTADLGVFTNQGCFFTSDPRGVISVAYNSGSNLTTVTVVTAPTSTCAQLAAAGLTSVFDLNQDCSVDFKDLAIFASNWLSSSLN